MTSPPKGTTERVGDPGPMALDEFNAASEAVADALLRPCLDVDRWIAAVMAGRPYRDREGVLAAAGEASEPLTPDEVGAALAHHPRIGEMPRSTSAEAALSRSEQAGLDTGGDVQARLAEGNRAYEQRFGRVFLIRAAGRSSSEILVALHERLGNEPETELAVVGQQLREIALLRLEGRVAQ